MSVEPEAHKLDDTAEQGDALFCPQCDYDLTGLTENRCPECGEAFEPAVLKYLAGHQPAPAVPWDEEEGLGGFLNTWWFALTEPTKLAATFPGRHVPEHATAYSAMAFIVAVGMFLGAAALLVLADGPIPGGEAIIGVFVVAAGAVFGFWICELMLAGTLTLIVKPRCVHDRSLRFHCWRGLTHYTSGFAILTGAWAGAAMLGTLLVESDNLDPNEFLVLMWGSLAVVFGWWVIAWWLIIAARGRPGEPKVLACILVPIVGVTATVLAISASILVAWVLFG